MALISRKNILMIIISLISSLWVAYKLYVFDEWPEFIAFFQQNATEFTWTLCITCFLMVINLSIESIKWRLLTKPVETISLKQSFIQVIKGIQLGLITPIRSGDPIGKALFFTPQKRTNIIFLSLTGSFIQSSIIFTFTIISVILTDSSANQSLQFILDRFMALDKTTSFTLIIMVLGIVFFYLFKHHFRSLIDFLHSLLNFSLLQLFQIIFLTIIRYMVFCFQLLILLHYFEPTVTSQGLLSIFLFYGILTFVPSWGSGDLGIRSAVALLIFGETAISGPAIILSTMLLWLINIALPALLPLFLYKKFNHYIPTTNQMPNTSK